jgi:hypothetical protein
VSPHSPRAGLRLGGVVAANTVPLAGVLTPGGDVHASLVLYWIEGLTTVVRPSLGLLAGVAALVAARVADLAVAFGPFLLLPVGLLCWAALGRI